MSEIPLRGGGIWWGWGMGGLSKQHHVSEKYWLSVIINRRQQFW